jgi:hypothetical protein
MLLDSPGMGVESQAQAFARKLDDSHLIAINHSLNADYRNILARLAAFTEEELSKRIRAYDSHQRFTLGRANTPKMAMAELADGVKSGTLFKPIKPNDHSAFLELLDSDHYPALYKAIIESVNILTNYGCAEGEGLISVYCHRVVVRPGNIYRGFLHRDNKKGEKCGTLVWYPNISYRQFAGCDFVCFNNDDSLPDSEIVKRKPDYFFSKEEYAGNILYLEYPHNLIHGVTIGKNIQDSFTAISSNSKEFLVESPLNFIKDLVVITLSDAPNAED